MHYFILPGNPPAAYFYQLWAREIAADYPGSLVTVSQYPQLPDTNDSSQAMNLLLDAHLKQMEDFCKSAGAPCTVIGHSLGGHFALKLLEQRPHLIKQAMLVHPFLRTPSFLGKMILKTAASVSRSPILVRSIIQTRHGLNYLSRDLKYVSDQEIQIAFHLARHEAVTIGKDTKPIQIQPEHRRKLTVFHTPKDTWCGLGPVSELKKLVTVVECPQPHGFVTLRQHRQSLFKKLKEYHD